MRAEWNQFFIESRLKKYYSCAIMLIKLILYDDTILLITPDISFNSELIYDDRLVIYSYLYF